MKIQSPKIAIPYPQPFHTPTRLPPSNVGGERKEIRAPQSMSREVKQVGGDLGIFGEQGCRSRPSTSSLELRPARSQTEVKITVSGFPADIPDPYARMPRGQKVSPLAGAAGKRTFWCGRPRFSARTSMTRRGVEKLCAKKVCVDFLAPI